MKNFKAVKLESQRANRTRYLVITSRCCYRSATTERRSKIMRHNSARIASSSSSSSTSCLSTTMAPTSSVAAPAVGTARQLSVDSNKPSSQHLQQLQQQIQQIDDNWVELRDKRVSLNSSASNRHSLKCDVSDKTCAAGDASGDSKNSSAAITQTTANSSATTGTSTNLNTGNTAPASSQDCVGVEESCLLGIDCNERTTIGLVVPILADTTIHLDGDGYDLLLAIFLINSYFFNFFIYSGFSVSVYGKTHIFKPVSVQAMW